jgi:UDP-glucose 4-epimerase
MAVFAGVYSVETVSLRYFNIFGPRQDANSQYSAVLAKFITLMLEGKSPTIYGDGEQSRDFTFVDNAVKANLLAAAAPAVEVSGKVFNVATGSRFSLNQTYQMLQKIIGFSGPVQYAPVRAGDVMHSLAEISLARKHLGYSPEVSFEEGLQRTVEWYRQKAGAPAGTAALAR